MTNRRFTETQMLEIMHMHEAEGMSFTRIAKKINSTRSAVAGIIWRVNRQTNATDNGNKNGTMPPRWWERAA